MSTIGTARKVYSMLDARERRSARWLMVLMAIGMLVETLGVGIMAPVIVLLTQSDFPNDYPQLVPAIERLGNPGRETLVMAAMVGLVAVYVIKNGFLALLAWRRSVFAQGVRVQLSQRLFAIYLRQPYTFHLERNSAQLIVTATSEVGMCSGALTHMMTVLTEVLVLSGIAALLLMVEPVGAVIVVVVLGGAAWGFQTATKARISRWGLARQHHDGLRVQQLQQGLGGAKDVKLLGRESDFLSQYLVHNAESARMIQSQATIEQIPRLWLELLAVIGLATLVVTMLARGQDTTDIVPTLGLFAAAAFRLMPSVSRVLVGVQALRYSRAAIDSVHEELELALPAPSTTRSVPAPLRDSIEMRGVSYQYQSAHAPSLNSVSIEIRRGESVGFVGPSGAGKSTLVDVILGLLTPTVGQVIVDGKDIQTDLRSWQDQIGYVPQAIYLTDDTLRRNVAFGLPPDQIDDAAVQRAIRAAQLEDFIRSLPEGLETVVGERGVRISGGQRQRIGIARALYHDPTVLVLDEATSALDVGIESGVMQAVTALQGTKTILIVAHRLSTVARCDRLYLLEGGSVVAQGETAEVLESRMASTA